MAREENMAKKAERIDRSLRGMQRVGKGLSVLFTGLLLLVLLALVSVLFTLFSRDVVFDMPWITDDTGFRLLVPIAVVWFTIIVLTLLVLRSISSDMARGVSPFTMAHARGINVIGGLFIVNFIAGFFGAWGTIELGADGSVRFLACLNSVLLFLGPRPIPVDVGSLLAALGCFALAAIWRYGALLQEQTEDLV
ncbi:MAG: hypothetical protein E7001_07820 [Coriobacteriaceae bacterium]|nr:hypothetical protein [Coriobacteriaceae bacterium]